MSYFRKLAYFNLIKFSILLLIITAMATVALSKDDEWSFGDPHLNVIPRTKALETVYFVKSGFPLHPRHLPQMGWALCITHVLASDVT